ncbi:MAG: hypothetical protein HN909_05950, partial [Phycisphaerales bacterium]|nr:hypothetical protein [Phycisphaerales bacterium]
DLDGIDKGLIKTTKAAPFRSVQFHSSRLDHTADHSSRRPLGYLLPAGALTKQLSKLATKAGVTKRNSAEQLEFELGEDRVHLLTAGKTYSARFLLAAQGHPNEILGALGRTSQASCPPQTMSAVALDVPLSPKQKEFLKKSLKGDLHIFELDERSELGVAFLLGATLHIRVISTSMASGLRTTELGALLNRLQLHKILPETLKLDRAKAAAWSPPAGMALEQETHDAKRTLLVGSAGGFADSVTGQTIYPTIASALIAAQVSMEAITAATPQDTLAEFHSTWREALVDYLRPPNTSIGMLLPLLFANDRIVGRFTEAIVQGEDL